MLAETQTAFEVSWEAMVAIMTAALAVATFWLGWQTKRLAGSTTEELDLLRTQTKAQQEQVDLLKKQMEDARADRGAALRPQLDWDHSGAQEMLAGDKPARKIDLLVRNRGMQAYLGEVRVDAGPLTVSEPAIRPLNYLLPAGTQYGFPLTTTGFAGRDEPAVMKVVLIANSYLPGARPTEFPIDVVVTPAGDFYLRPA